MLQSDEALLVAPRRSVLEHVRLTWRYRELLTGLVRKELKVKYKNSVLGFVWSLLNPMLYLVVFYFVFVVIFKVGIPAFPIYFLSGLLVWNLFAGSVGTGVTSVVDNSSLVKKVYFPREVLPLAAVGAAVVNFTLQTLVLLGSLFVFRWGVDVGYFWLVVPALLVTVVFASALCILLAATNVYFRDTRHLMEIVLLAWFWATPIAYQYSLVADRAAARGVPWLPLINPMTSVVIAMQRAIYGQAVVPSPTGGTTYLLPDASAWWYARNLAIVGIGATALLAVAIHLFDRAEGGFAEVI